MRGSIIVAGLDPGASGAIAILSYQQPTSKSIQLVRTFPMPTITEKNGKKRLDAIALYKILKTWMPEKVHVERITGGIGKGESPASMFNYGGTYFSTLTTLDLSGFHYTLTVPSVWKKKAGLIKQPKSQSKAMARELWPDQKTFLTTPDKAEAALIGRHGILHGL